MSVYDPLIPEPGAHEARDLEAFAVTTAAASLWMALAIYRRRA